MKVSSADILAPEWEAVSWLPDASTPVQENGTLHFRFSAGQRALVQQRIMSVTKNCEGPFRYSAWIKCPPHIFPAVSISVYPVYTVKRKTITCTAKATGAEKDGFREYACSFEAPPQTGEIRPTAGISGKASAAGEMIIRDMRLRPLITPAEKVTLWHMENDERQGIFYPDEQPFAVLNFKNSAAAGKELTLNGSLRGLDGQEKQSFTVTAKLPAASITPVRIEFPKPDRLGFFSVHLVWNDGEKEQTAICPFVMTSPELKRKDPLFGITFMARNAENAEAMKRLGCGTKGLFIMREAVEHMDGSFHWEQVDRDLAALQSAGIEPVGGIEITTMRIPVRYLADIQARKKRGENPFSEEYYKAASRFEEAMFQRYRGKIRKWAVIGEIDLLKNRNPYEYEHYIKRVKNCYQTMKRVAPENSLSGIGCSGSDGGRQPRFPVLRDLWFQQKLSDSLDGLGIDQYTNPHAYGPGYTPVNSETGKIREIMQEAVRIAHAGNQKKSVSIDEKGFKIVQTLPVDSPYAVRMAENLSRYYVTLKSVPEVEHFLYFLWRRWRAGEEFDYGLWLDRFPRPTVSAYAAAARIIGNAEFLRRIELHSDIPCYLFEKQGKRIAALWLGGTAEGKAGVAMKSPAGLKILDMEGNPVPARIRDGKLLLTLSSAPLFLVSDDSAAEWTEMLRTADTELPSVSMCMIPKDAGHLEVILRNHSHKSVSGELSMNNSLTQWRQNYTVAPQGYAKLTVPLNNSSPEKISALPLTLVSTGRNGQVFELSESFRIFRVPQVSGQSAVAELPALVKLDNGELYLNIPDYISKGVWKEPADCSAELRMGYDRENLYLHIRVRDDIHVNEKYTADSLWAGDSVQFALDPLLNAKEQAMHGKNGLFGDDYFFTAALSHGKPRMFCHLSGSGADWSGVTPAIRRDETTRTTVYEIALPWTKLEPLHFGQKTFFGFNFLVMDSDNPAKAPVYWMQLTPGIAGGQKPELYHLFVLE